MLAKEKTRILKKPSMEERIVLAREIGRLARDGLIALMLIYCLVQPSEVRRWIAGLGISKLSLFGMELTPVAEQNIATAIDSLTQQRDVAVFERNTLRTTAHQTLAALNQSTPPMTPAQRTAIDALQREAGPETRIVPPSETPTQRHLIQGARREEPGGGDWAVVFGGHPDLAAANADVAWARTHHLGEALIVLRENSYRVALPAEGPVVAAQLVPDAQVRRPDAYIVNLDSWCPGRTDLGAYRECR